MSEFKKGVPPIVRAHGARMVLWPGRLDHPHYPPVNEDWLRDTLWDLPEFKMMEKHFSALYFRPDMDPFKLQKHFLDIRFTPVKERKQGAEYRIQMIYSTPDNLWVDNYLIQDTEAVKLDIREAMERFVQFLLLSLLTIKRTKR